MKARLDTGYERLDAAQAAQVDAVCDAFEAALVPALFIDVRVVNEPV